MEESSTLLSTYSVLINSNIIFKEAKFIYFLRKSLIILLFFFLDS